MTWQEIRAYHPHQWLLVEALEAHSENGKRIIEDIAIIKIFADSREAMQVYKQFHRKEPNRELLVLHTDRELLDIEERKWLGLRGV